MSEMVNSQSWRALAGHLVLPATASAATLRTSANNTLVSAENAGASFLIANRTHREPRVAILGGEQCRRHYLAPGDDQRRFVTTDLGNGGRLITSQAAIGTNVKFR